jgi:hypothetical protein
LNGDFVSGFTTIAAVTAIAAVPIAAAYLFWGSERAVFVGVIELALFTPILALLQRFRKFVFPQLIVDVGRSADIAARAKSARTTLFVGIFLALVVGVASSLIANKIPQ